MKAAALERGKGIVLVRDAADLRARLDAMESAVIKGEISPAAAALQVVQTPRAD